MTADANILINYARQAAQNYLLTYNEDIPCEQLVRRLCDLKQGYTQHGGLLPRCCLVMGAKVRRSPSLRCLIHLRRF